MTADTAALQERIGRILNDEGWTFEGVHEPGEYDECEDCRLTVDPIAARIAQEVAAEVAKTLRTEAHDLMEDIDEGPVTEKDIALFQVRDRLLHRATEYETGAEHD